jgi:hypothetical protein
MFLVKVTRNRERGSVWGFPLDAVQVAAICLTLMTSPQGCCKYPLACLGEGDGLPL